MRSSAFRELYVERFHVLLEMRSALASRNRHDVATLREHPGECELRWRNAFLGGNLFDPSEEIEVPVEIAGLESRIAAAPVVGFEIVDRFDLAGEKTAAERTVRDESDSELAHRRQNLFFRIARPGRTRSAIAPIVSSIGMVLSTRCW